MRRVLPVLVASFLLALSAPPALSQTDSADVTFWQSVQDTKDPAELEAYLEAYPQGKFAPLARIRLKKLKTAGSAKAQDRPSPGIAADVREQLDLFGDVLERVRNDFVVKPDDKELIRTAIEGIAKSFPDDALADFKQSQLDKLQQLLATSDKAQLFGALDVFGDVLERWLTKRKPKASAKALIEAALDGMMSGLDPHSEYLRAEKHRDAQVQTRGEFGGLGIEVTMQDGLVKVVTPIDDTPAHRAGLLPGDIITHLDEERILGRNLQQWPAPLKRLHVD